MAGKNTALGDAFKLADEVLLSAVRGISDLITVHGLINLDFADVRAIMTEAGVALMGNWLCDRRRPGSRSGWVCHLEPAT